MTQILDVEGYCPSCGKRDLHRMSGGLIQCLNLECPDQGAAQKAFRAPAATGSLLDLVLPERPSGCGTVREYLVKLLGEFFCGQVNFKYGMSGESDWLYDLYAPMINVGLLPGREAYVNDGYGLSQEEEKIPDDRIAAAIRELK